MITNADIRHMHYLTARAVGFTSRIWFEESNKAFMLWNRSLFYAEKLDDSEFTSGDLSFKFLKNDTSWALSKDCLDGLVLDEYVTKSVEEGGLLYSLSAENPVYFKTEHSLNLMKNHLPLFTCKQECVAPDNLVFNERCLKSAAEGAEGLSLTSVSEDCSRVNFRAKKGGRTVFISLPSANHISKLLSKYELMDKGLAPDEWWLGKNCYLSDDNASRVKILNEINQLGCGYWEMLTRDIDVFH